MAKLIILRHFKSQWNLEDRFTGWVNVPISDEGKLRAKEVGEKLNNFKIDVIYTSPLVRNLDTVTRAYDYVKGSYPIFISLDGGKMEKWGKFSDSKSDYIPAYVSENLNERYYGSLQGLNKAETKAKFGEEKVQSWRRSFKVKPPKGESLEETYKRTVPFYKKRIEKDLKAGKNVLVASSHNSLRSIIKYIEKIGDNEISAVEIPFGGLLVLDFDKNMEIKSKTNF